MTLELCRTLAEYDSERLRTEVFYSMQQFQFDSTTLLEQGDACFLSFRLVSNRNGCLAVTVDCRDFDGCGSAWENPAGKHVSQIVISMFMLELCRSKNKDNS